MGLAISFGPILIIIIIINSLSGRRDNLKIEKKIEKLPIPNPTSPSRLLCSALHRAWMGSIATSSRPIRRTIPTTVEAAESPPPLLHTTQCSPLEPPPPTRLLPRSPSGGSAAGRGSTDPRPLPAYPPNPRLWPFLPPPRLLLPPSFAPKRAPLPRPPRRRSLSSRRSVSSLLHDFFILSAEFFSTSFGCLCGFLFPAPRNSGDCYSII